MNTNEITMRQLGPCLKANMKAGIPTMIWGKPGVGKSDGVKQLAFDDPGLGLIDFRATLRDAVDLRGLPLVDAKSATTRWLPPSELPNEARDGKRGILFMDELPQAHPSVQTACFSLVLDRYIGEYHLPDGWHIIAAGNRTQDRSGASKMLKALANRFAHFEVKEDVESWAQWASESGLNPLVQAFIRFRPELLHKMADGEENSFPTPRAWANVAKIADEQDERLRARLVQALVGQGAAAEFEGFVRVWQELPSIELIFDAPREASIPAPDKIAALYATCAAISRRVGKKSMANALVYARRMPEEFQVFWVADAVHRDPSLKETRAFGDWLAEHQEVIL